MRLGPRRAPSWGFVYLAATVAAFAAGVAWLRQPFWYELEGRAAMRAQADYELRLAAAVDGEARQQRLERLLDTAVVRGLHGGDWGIAFAALEAMGARGMLPASRRCVAFAPGRLWLVGATPDGRGRAPQLQLVVRNDAAAARDVVLRWRRLRPDVAAAVVTLGGERTPLEFAGDAAEVVIPDLPPDACALRHVECPTPDQLELRGVELRQVSAPR